MRERPLSPHLSIYRFRYTLTSSIANRMTGIALSAGFPLLVAWLVAVASGPEPYDRALRALTHVAGRVVLALVLIAFVYHTLAGLRHLLWDMGYFLERRQSIVSAWILGTATLVVAGLLIYVAFFDPRGHT
jgi:succinate dehydrogenase / fumarate reductase, cytochrome b subunit